MLGQVASIEVAGGPAVIDRYDIDGFFVDENDPGGNSDIHIDFHRMERAIRWRKPDAVLIQNFYGNLYAFDAPIGEACGLRVEEVDAYAEEPTAIVSLTDCALGVLSTRETLSQAFE